MRNTSMVRQAGGWPRSPNVARRATSSVNPVAVIYNARASGGQSMLRINDEAPNFTAETSQGTINFHEWIGDGWAILFSHPKDFTPVCTTEPGYMAGLHPEFEKRNCKIIA